MLKRNNFSNSPLQLSFSFNKVSLFFYASLFSKHFLPVVSIELDLNGENSTKKPQVLYIVVSSLILTCHSLLVIYSG